MLFYKLIAQHFEAARKSVEEEIRARLDQFMLDYFCDEIRVDVTWINDMVFEDDQPWHNSSLEIQYVFGHVAISWYITLHPEFANGDHPLHIMVVSPAVGPFEDEGSHPMEGRKISLDSTEDLDDSLARELMEAVRELPFTPPLGGKVATA